MSKRTASPEDLTTSKKKRRVLLDVDLNSCSIFRLTEDCFSFLTRHLDTEDNNEVQNGKLSFLDVINLDRTCAYFHFNLELERTSLWARIFLPRAPHVFDASSGELLSFYAESRMSFCLDCTKCRCIYREFETYVPPQRTEADALVVVDPLSLLDGFECVKYVNEWGQWTMKPYRKSTEVSRMQVFSDSACACLCETGKCITMQRMDIARLREMEVRRSTPGVYYLF